MAYFHKNSNRIELNFNIRNRFLRKKFRSVCRSKRHPTTINNVLKEIGKERKSWILHDNRPCNAAKQDSQIRILYPWSKLGIAEK